MKIVFIIGGIMLLVGILCNVFAVVFEKKYKSKMQNISKE